MEEKKPTFKDMTKFWLIISVAVVLILAVIGSWGYFLEKRFPMKEPKPAPMVEKFNEATWMKNENLQPDGWVGGGWPSEWTYYGSSILEPVAGEMGIIVAKYKTEKQENALIYRSFRLGKKGVYRIERMAVTVFCIPPPFKHAVWQNDKKKWEEVEHFEFTVNAIPHDRPWISVNFSYMPMKAQ